MRTDQLLKIYTATYPILKETSHPVGEVTQDIRKTFKQMLETMYHAEGIGLAAAQVGIHQRLITIDLQRRAEDGEPFEPLFMVNPEIIAASEEKASCNEGCLSVPEHYAEVWRPANIRVKYLDFDGKEQILDASGLLSACVQHEIDHLNGVLFIDYLSGLKRNIIIRKLKKAQAQDEAEKGQIL
jgi:peptide deformylase